MAATKRKLERKWSSRFHICVQFLDFVVSAYSARVETGMSLSLSFGLCKTDECKIGKELHQMVKNVYVPVKYTLVCYEYRRIEYNL